MCNSHLSGLDVLVSRPTAKMNSTFPERALNDYVPGKSLLPSNLNDGNYGGWMYVSPSPWELIESVWVPTAPFDTWIAFEFVRDTAIERYGFELMPAAVLNTNAPESWTLQAMDKVMTTYGIIDQRSGQGATDFTTARFCVTFPAKYRKYRLQVSAMNAPAFVLDSVIVPPNPALKIRRLVFEGHSTP